MTVVEGCNNDWALSFYFGRDRLFTDKKTEKEIKSTNAERKVSRICLFSLIFQRIINIFVELFLYIVEVKSLSIMTT